MANTLINGIYPVDYLFLTGVDQIKHPDEFWWASRGRLAPAQDFLELDYGRVRQINYLKFSVLRAPIDIDIWYDSISDDDGTHRWVKVEPVEHERFDDTIHYSPAHRNMWHDAQFYFTDRQGNTINTRFLRIGFTRRREAWPHSGAQPFKWNIMVRNLRSSRFVNDYGDTLGTMFDTGAASDEPTLRTFMGITQAQYDDPAFLISDWVEQTFEFGDDVPRAGTLWPNLLGFSVLAFIEPQVGNGPQPDPDDVRMEWQLLREGVLVRSGVTKGSVGTGRTWINTYFNPSAPIDTTPDDVMNPTATTWTLRVRSRSVHDPQGTKLFGKLVLDGGAMFYRLWGDVGDTGRDVLGNFYRQGTRIDEPQHAAELAVSGWMSEPRPSPNAVEALYFDVRGTDAETGARLASSIDAIRIAPRTPGIEMHVYYTDMGLQTETVQTANQYDHMLWNPVPATFKLTGSQRTIELPDTIRAAFVKLEFTKLQPKAFKVPSRPDPPTQTYRRYPTWVEMQFHDKDVREAVNQYFLTAEKRKEVNIKYFKSLRDPILEFQYKMRTFLAALASNEKIRRTKANEDLINQKKNTFLDETTLSKIHVQTPTKYQGPLTLQVDRDSVLGQIIIQSQDTTLRTTLREGGFQARIGIQPNKITGQTISESFSQLAQTPMWFNRTCRHIYANDSAKFGRVAYFAGVDNVQFLNKDYTVARDDEYQSFSFHDLEQLEQNDWVADKPSRIYNAVAALGVGEILSLVVDYTIDATNVTGEVFTFSSVDDTYTLAIPGATEAVGLRVFQNLTPESTTPTRGFEYTINKDYAIAATTIESGDDAGKVATTLDQNVLHERLVTQLDDS